MDFIDNIISALIGGLIAFGLTYWRMRVSKATRKNDLHNAALGQTEIWETALEQFLTRYHLTEPTDDFRLLLLDLAKVRSEVSGIKSCTRTMTRLTKDIQGKDLLSGLEKVSEAVEKLDELFAGTSFDTEDIKKRVDELRKSFKLVQSTLQSVKHL